MFETNISAIILDYAYLGDKSLFAQETNDTAKAGIKLEFGSCKTEEDIIKQAQGYQVILCCGNPPITKHVMESLPACKYVIRYGIGTNSVDLKAASELGKIVYFMPGFCAEELSMHSTAMAFSLIRNLKYFDDGVRKGSWPKGTGPKPTRLSNMTVGLYGFGTSAQMVAQAFSKGYMSRVIACDPFADEKIAQELNVTVVDFDTLLKESDVISIHAPLNNSTKHVFNSESFKKMKNSAYIINTSRGPIISELDLIDALRNGEIAGAGLDVLEQEPIAPDNPLIGMNNVILTPHTAFFGKESLESQHKIAADLVVMASVGKVSRKNVANQDVLAE